MEEMAVIGKILSSHGVHGAFKVQPYSDFPERVSMLRRVYLEKGGQTVAYPVVAAALHGRFWVIRVDGISTPEEARALAGTLVKIPLSERVPLPAGVYYLDEIIGLDVYTVCGRFLGRVSDVLQTGSNDVYVVSPGRDGKDLLIPALKTVVYSIDKAARRMEVELPEGLL